MTREEKLEAALRATLAVLQMPERPQAPRTAANYKARAQALEALAAPPSTEERPARCDCCGHPPHDDLDACGAAEPKWEGGKCRCIGSTWHPTRGYNGRRSAEAMALGYTKAPAPSPRQEPGAQPYTVCQVCGGSGKEGTGTPSGEGGEDFRECWKCCGTGAVHIFTVPPAPRQEPGCVTCGGKREVSVAEADGLKWKPCPGCWHTLSNASGPSPAPRQEQEKGCPVERCRAGMLLDASGREQVSCPVCDGTLTPEMYRTLVEFHRNPDPMAQHTGRPAQADGGGHG